MKRTHTQTIREVLDVFLEDHPVLTTKLAETRLINAWSKVLGNLTVQYTSKIYIKNQVLYVHLTSSVLRSELTMCREKLITRLNNEAGREVISDIVFI